MKDRFKKLLGGVSRRKLSKKEFEDKTGTSLEKADDEASLRSQYEDAETEEEKKKIKQRAFIMGFKVD